MTLLTPIVHYRPAPDLEAGFAHLRELEGSYRLALWPYLEHLWPVWLAWMATAPRRKTERKGLQFGGYISAFAEASGLKVSSLYAHLPASRFIHEARLWEAQNRFPALVSVAAGMDSEAAATLGRALEANHTPESLEGVLQVAPDLSAALEMVKGWLSEGATNSNADRKDAREIAHTRLRELAPNAPEGGRERDALIYGGFNALSPRLALAALYAAQTGDKKPLEVLGDRVLPDYGAFLKQHFPCWVTGDYSAGGEVHDLHHVRIGDREARPGDDTPDTLVPVARHAHIPLPFAEGSGAAHSRAYIVGNDAARLAALNRWQACAVRAYAAFVRGEDWRRFAEQARGERLR